MTRRLLAPAILAALAGCQDYNFNPVGKCIIQTGSARVEVTGVTTADILFVVDDSGSMRAEQQRLADNFGAFITALAKTQADRKAIGLEPIEFHIAITTSSVFEAHVPNLTPAPVCGTPTAGQCILSSSTDPNKDTPAELTSACTAPGDRCVDIIESYWTGGASCPAPGTPYTRGDFFTAGANPRVLHFTKDLAWETWNTPGQDPRITALVDQFRANINVGVCGSGMEQHLEAGRLAVQKAVAGTQPGIAAGEWPHPGAKLVVVWVGDEDDCSNPKDPTRSLAFPAGGGAAGNDVCTQDDVSAAPKKFPVSEYVEYFTSLGRPLGAAFIYSTPPSSCAPDASGNIVCTAGTCACECPTSCASCGPSQPGICNIDAQCGGKSNRTRLHDMSKGLRDRGVSTLDASVCAADFGTTLTRIAELVKPPAGLTLPSQPAASEVALLRVEDAAGAIVHRCTGPGSALDWTFVDCRTGNAVPDNASGRASATTACIAINPAVASAPASGGARRCVPNPGESYVAQYLGMVPPSGCAAAADCSAALGGTADQWTCDIPAGQARGTCLCSGI
jgi:hypothetical protein